MSSSLTLFSAPHTRGLAEKMQSLAADLSLGTIRWDSFPDSWPQTFIEEVDAVRGRDVAFLAAFEDPRDIFAQMSVLYALPRYEARSLTVFLPFFSTGTMDRVDKPGEIVTAATLARMLSAIPHCHGAGPARIVICDIHALQERFYFSDNVIPVLISSIPLLKERLLAEPEPDKISIAYPDDGAFKRFHGQFAEYPQIICEKRRDGAKRIVTIKEGDPRGRHAVIVDDLIMTGGTALECKVALLAAGALQTSLYATHPVFPDASWRRFLDKSFRRIWVTDS
ncbi:MAG: ribose-phosphate pyrophosphokinase-like domain-containing protein, partial [Patescibacteria group bacterium]